MEIISILLHGTIFSFVFLFFYYINVKLSGVTIFKKSFVMSNLRTQTDSIYYAFLTLIYIIVSRGNTVVISSLFIIAGMITLTIVGLWESMFVFFIGFIYSIWFIDITIFTYLSVLTYLSYLLVYNLTSTYLKKEIANNVTNFVQIIVWLLVFILFAIIRVENLFDVFYNTLGIVILATLLSYLNYFVIRASLSANSLTYSIEYSYLNYYRLKYRNSSVLNYIRQGKFSKGIYVTFVIKILSDVTEDERDEVRETVLERIEKILQTKSSVWFRSKKHYGLFFGINQVVDLEKSTEGNKDIHRINGDVLKTVESLFEIIPSRYETIAGNDVFVRINAAASIYGVQSSSINELDDMNNYTLLVTGKTDGNIVKLVDPIAFKKRIVATQQLNLLNSKYRIDNYVVRYDEVFDSQMTNIPLTIGTQIKGDLDINFRDIRYIKKKRWVAPIFDRYFAFYALVNFKHKKENIGDLAFYYSPQILEDEIVIDEFIASLHNAKFSAARVKLIFPQSQLNLVRNNEVFLKNISEFRMHGIEFFLHYNEPQNYESFNEVSFKKAIIYERDLLKDFKNKYNIEVIFADVKSSENIEELEKQGVNYFTSNSPLGR